MLGVNAEGTHVAIVHDWRVGPYQIDPRATLPNNNSAEWYEDPLIWWSFDGRWRQLVHQYPVLNGHPAAQFATGGYGEQLHNASDDFFSPWTFGGLANPAYTNNVTYLDGHVETLNRRERPKLLFASDGTTWLYNAVQSHVNASRDFSFTLVQQVLAMPA